MRTFPYDRPVDNRPASIAYSDAGKATYRYTAGNCCFHLGSAFRQGKPLPEPVLHGEGLFSPEPDTGFSKNADSVPQRTKKGSAFPPNLKDGVSTPKI